MYRHKVLFLISKKSGLECLKSFIQHDAGQSKVDVVTFNDKVDDRNCFDAINKYCKDKCLNLNILENNKEFLSSIIQYHVDAVFVCGWYWIIPNSVLEYFNNKVFGIHHSLLPKYRGFSPLVWSMINGEPTVGSSLFKISDGVDVGDVYFQWSFSRENKHIGQILSEIELKISEDFGWVFKQILNGDILGIEQDHRAATYCARRHVSSGIIDWRKSAQEIIWLIKAQSDPYPGAYFEVDSKYFVIENAEPFNHPINATPGQVVMYTETGVIIGCGDGYGIEVKKIRGTDKLKEVFYSHDLILGGYAHSH